MILVPMPPGGGYVPVCQKLIISKYNHVTPHVNGNFVLNRNEVVKSSKKNTILTVLNFFSQVQKQKSGFFFYKFYYFKPVINFLQALMEKEISLIKLSVISYLTLSNSKNLE